MNYIVYDTARGHVFGTLEEAIKYADLYFHLTGVLVEVSTTKRAISHSFIGG